MSYYNRYKKLIENGLTKQMPFIKLSEKSTDKSKIWVKSIDRLDVLSQRYYDNPDGGWLIQLANPQFVDEFEIPDGAFIRIPYPYDTTIQEFVDKMNLYDTKYGF